MGYDTKWLRDSLLRSWRDLAAQDATILCQKPRAQPQQRGGSDQHSVINDVLGGVSELENLENLGEHP